MFNFSVKKLNKLKKRIIENIDLGSFAIVATFFSLWLAVFFEKHIEDFLAYILILTFGILHGANDIKLLQKANKQINSRNGFLITLLYYVLFVGTSGLLFLFIPSLALALFVLFSGYHFGEQHWIGKVKKMSNFNSVLFLTYGLFILFLIFSSHSFEVSEIILNICGFSLPDSFYKNGAVFLGLTTCLLCSYVYFKKNLIFNIPKQIFYIIVFYIVFNSASLLWAFTIYFILWHSLPSIVDQIQYLYGETNAKNMKKYFISSFPYWIISVIGMGLILFLFRESLSASLAFFFSFLAAITFPHVLVISKLNKD